MISPYSTAGTNSHGRPRILIFSQRGLGIERWRCCGLEFEDVVRGIDDVEMVAPSPSKTSDARLRVMRGVSRHVPQVRAIGSGLAVTPEYDRYDMLFAEAGYMGELLALAPLKKWRKKCALTVCYVEEIFVSYLDRLKGQLELLKEFDLIFCACAGTVDELSERLGREVTYLPPGVDALRFRPTLEPDERAIEVAMLGRRSVETHQALIEHAAATGAFYFHDGTWWAPKLWVTEPSQHRILLANILKNARFFIANRANFDRRDKIRTQEEIGFRFFEGAAAGAVLLGDHPRTEEFQTLFGWDESVIPIPADCPKVGDIVRDLNTQPERLRRISRHNVKNSLLRHDWVYRWRTILDAAGLPPTEMTTLRTEQLARLSADIDVDIGAKQKLVAV